MFRRLLAFIRRDYQLAATYRWSVGMDVLRTSAILVSFFFVSKLVPGKTSAFLAPFGGDYFQFVFLGVAFSGFMAAAMNSVSGTIGFEQGHGTLETILLTSTPLTLLALWKLAWDLVVTTAKVGFYFLLGMLLLKVRFPHANWSGSALIVGLMIASYVGAGFLSAGFNLMFRESNPLEGLLTGASRFLAGVYFPTTVLPGFLKIFSIVLPLTYALTALRSTILVGTSLAALSKELAVLGLFAMILCSLGPLFFGWAFRQAQKQGTLSFE